MGGAAPSTLGIRGTGRTRYGRVGAVVLFVGPSLGLAGTPPAALADPEEAARAPGRVEPRPIEGPGAIAWATNNYRATMLRREGRFRLALLPVAALAVVSWTLVVTEPPFPNWLIGVTVGSAFLSIVLFAICIPLGLRRNSRLAPTRVGLSERGVHAEYASARGSGALMPGWVTDYVPWTEVASVRAPPFGGSSHQLNFQRVGGGVWVMFGLDPDIVASVEQAWDKLPALPLPSSPA
jgi:hypothetical protein